MWPRRGRDDDMRVRAWKCQRPTCRVLTVRFVGQDVPTECDRCGGAEPVEIEPKRA